MTAAILPISPLWQLRDSRYDRDLQPSKTEPVLYEGGTWPIYMRVQGWILWWYWQQWPTMCPVCISAVVDKEIPVGVFISCVHSWAGNIRRQGNIKGFISCQETRRRANIRLRTAIQRPHRRASDRKADPFRRIHVRMYTRTHVIYV